MNMCKIKNFKLAAVLLISAFSLTACSGISGNSDVSNEPAETSPAVSAEATPVSSATATDNGSPWLNSNLKENVSEATITDPKDDLYLSVNKDWILSHDIPDGEMMNSVFDERQREVDNNAISLLQDNTLTGRNAELSQTLFNLAIDWDARNKDGLKSLEEIYKALKSASTLQDLENLMLVENPDVPCLVDIGVDTGISDSDSYVAFIGTPSLILGDSQNYTELSEYGQINEDYNRELYLYYAGRMGESAENAEQQFNNALALEKMMAEYIPTNEETMAADYIESINNVMSFEEATALTRNFPLAELIKKQKIYYNGNYIVTEPDYVKALDTIFTEENFELIRDEMLVNYLTSMPLYLDQEGYLKTHELNDKYYGSSGIIEKEKMGYRVVCSFLPDQLAKMYIENNNTEEDRQKIEKICYEVIDTYREMLNDNEWLSTETKDYAIQKLDSITVNVGWPDAWEDDTGLSIDGCTFAEALKKINNYYADAVCKKLGTAFNKEIWADNLGVNLLECNAYYLPSDNSINMPLGMMGEPIYSADMSTENLYASLIPSWIGHEVSHAFDSNGAQYDKDGNLRNWWTEEDLAEFEKRIGKLDEYLDSILIMGDYHVNGSNVDSETLAEITGMQCALKIASKIEKFDYKEFFERFAYTRAQISSYQINLYCMESDPHPLDFIRANVVIQQAPEFYETFGVKEGDRMYLAPENRVAVW